MKCRLLKTYFVTPKSIPSVDMYLGTNLFSQQRFIRQLWIDKKERRGILLRARARCQIQPYCTLPLSAAPILTILIRKLLFFPLPPPPSLPSIWGIIQPVMQPQAKSYRGRSTSAASSSLFVYAFRLLLWEHRVSSWRPSLNQRETLDYHGNQSSKTPPAVFRPFFTSSYSSWVRVVQPEGERNRAREMLVYLSKKVNTCALLRSLSPHTCSSPFLLCLPTPPDSHSGRRDANVFGMARNEGIHSVRRTRRTAQSVEAGAAGRRQRTVEGTRSANDTNNEPTLTRTRK